MAVTTDTPFNYDDLLEEAEHGWRSRFTWLVLALVLVTAIATGLWWELLRGSSTATGTVQTATVDRGSITKVVSTTGTVAAQSSTALSFQQSGRVTKVNVTLGQAVKQGDVLAELDAAALQNALASAQANLKGAQIKLDQLLQGSDAATLAAADQSVVQAQAAYSKAVNDLKDLTTPPTPADLAAAQQAVAQAQSQLTQAQANRDKLSQPVADADLQTLQAAVTQAQTSLTSAQNALDNADNSLTSATAALQAVETAYCPDADVEFCTARAAPLSAHDEQVLLAVTAGGTPERAAQASSVLASNTSYKAAANARANAEANVGVAQQNLSAANAKLSAALAGPTADDIATADAAVTSAQQALNAANAKLAALQAGPTATQLANAQDAVASAQAALDAAKAKRDQAYAGATHADIAAQRNQVQLAQLQVEAAELNLQKAQLIAPFDGTVAALNIQVGDVMGASGGTGGSTSSSAPIVLNTPENVRIDLTISESDLPNVRPGQSGFATFDAIPGRPFPIAIESIGTNPTVTQGVVTYAARARILSGRLGAAGGAGNEGAAGAGASPAASPSAAGSPEATTTPAPGQRQRGFGAGPGAGSTAVNDAKPAPGMNAKVTIVVDQRQNVLRVPSSAIQRDQQGSYVEVKQADGTTQRVAVQTGLSDSANTEITSGLDEGQVVVIPERTASATQTNGQLGAFPAGGVPGGFRGGGIGGTNGGGGGTSGGGR